MRRFELVEIRMVGNCLEKENIMVYFSLGLMWKVGRFL